MGSVVLLPVQTVSEDRSEVLSNIAAMAQRKPGQFDRLLVIAAPSDGEPKVWSRGMTMLEMAALADFIRHALLTHSLSA